MLRPVADTLCAAFALAAPAVAHAALSPPYVAVPASHGADYPNVRFDAAGDTVLLFEALTTRHDRVAARVRRAAFGPIRKVSGPDTGPDETLQNPLLTMDRRGDAVAEWAELFSGRPWLAVRRPGGRFAGPQQIGVGNYHEMRVAVGRMPEPRP